MRIGKMVRFGRTRSTVALDILNAFNSDAILAYNPTFNADVAGADDRDHGPSAARQRADGLVTIDRGAA